MTGPQGCEEARNALLREVLHAIRQSAGHGAGCATAHADPASFLGADLGLSSIAVARLTGILRRRFDSRRLPFHTLFITPDGAMLHDIRVADLVAFLERHAGPEAP